MKGSLDAMHADIISSAKKGYPILLSGAIVFFIFTFLPMVFPMKTVHLIWIFGLMAIFPFGLLIGKIMNIDLLANDNPLGTLGGLVAAPQAFFIPVFIIVYMHIPEYIPFTIGLLGGSHFIPYFWIYKSKAYLTVTLGVCVSSFILGSYFIDQAFTLVPLAISFFYLVGVFQIFRELRQEKAFQLNM
ncbi:DUF7010 family protein [Peribacillus sp. SCS-155]|uniref:DUF7010 family protein n=1 Tax=Peribacillus sedimenti TaxID=3115297 RepID=UPI0039068484